MIERELFGGFQERREGSRKIRGREGREAREEKGGRGGKGGGGRRRGGREEKGREGGVGEGRGGGDAVSWDNWIMAQRLSADEVSERDGVRPQFACHQSLLQDLFRSGQY